MHVGCSRSAWEIYLSADKSVERFKRGRFNVRIRRYAAHGLAFDERESLQQGCQGKGILPLF
jgi:hypothetical protein